MMQEATQRILVRCREMGFALAGVCDATPTAYGEELLDWLRQGHHGEMGYLTRSIDLRLDPQKFVPGAKSILCVADRYAGEKSTNPQVHKSTGVGRIARYARGKDYHRIMRDRLGKFCRAMVKEFPGNRFRSCVDTAPVLEREYAQRAGIGAIGKNTMILQRGEGSWLLLGEVITTLPLVASRPAEPDPCGSCTRCIEACPTQAIATDGWRVDATRCISYLTIEHQSLIDQRFHAAIGEWIFGCDICQDVCPHNQPKSSAAELATHPAYAPRREGFDLLEVLGWNESDRQQAMINSAMKRARLDMLKRNALIALGNQAGDPNIRDAAIKAIEHRAGDESEHALVRETARQTLRRISRAGGCA